MSKKILYFESNIKKGCNYYQEFRDNLAKIHNLKIITSDLKKEINKFNPDMILIGFSVTDVGDEAPTLNLNDVSKPMYIFLNKEYAALDKKLEWIKYINPPPLKIFTVHHDYQKFQDITNITCQRIMWSANHKIFKKYNDEYKYDFFFSGVVRKEQTDDMRNKIYHNLKFLKKYKLLVNARFYENNKNLNKSKIFSNDDYAKNISDSKICLTTTGPADLVGTRYFEIMATNKALIMCNRMPENIYDKIVIDKYNCIMFDDENDFVAKCKYYLKNEEERLKIVKTAYQYFLDNHTWSHKIDHLNNLLI